MAKSATEKASWLRMPQTKLGQSGLIVLITLVNTIMPFTTDMYTPAIPSLPDYFGTSEAMVNLTLVGFFLFMTISVLFVGPLSDRFGRKPLFPSCFRSVRPMDKFVPGLSGQKQCPEGLGLQRLILMILIERVKRFVSGVRKLFLRFSALIFG